MSSTTADVLRDLGRMLDAAGVDWYLFGAQAALLRGLRRSTADVDVTVLPGALTTEELLRRLSGGFVLAVEDHDRFVARTRVLPLRHRATQMPVDLVLGGPGLEEHFSSRCEQLIVDEQTVRVPLAEDLVLMKLLAGRPQDLDDAAALVRAGADLSEVEPMVEAVAEGLGEAEASHAVLARASRSHAVGGSARPPGVAYHRAMHPFAHALR